MTFYLFELRFVKILYHRILNRSRRKEAVANVNLGQSLLGGYFVHIPYVPVNGSLKIPISGVRKVNTTKSMAISKRVAIAHFGFLQDVISFLNNFVSYR